MWLGVDKATTLIDSDTMVFPEIVSSPLTGLPISMIVEARTPRQGESEEVPWQRIEVNWSLT